MPPERRNSAYFQKCSLIVTFQQQKAASQIYFTFINSSLRRESKRETVRRGPDYRLADLLVHSVPISYLIQ